MICQIVSGMEWMEKSTFSEDSVLTTIVSKMTVCDQIGNLKIRCLYV